MAASLAYGPHFSPSPPPCFGGTRDGAKCWAQSCRRQSHGGWCQGVLLQHPAHPTTLIPATAPGAPGPPSLAEGGGGAEDTAAVLPEASQASSPAAWLYQPPPPAPFLS